MLHIVLYLGYLVDSFLYVRNNCLDKKLLPVDKYFNMLITDVIFEIEMNVLDYTIYFIFPSLCVGFFHSFMLFFTSDKYLIADTMH